jgi:hypothetical protein
MLVYFEQYPCPRVMMQVGGWESFEAIEPYLNEPTPKVVDEALAEAGLV